MERKNRVTYRAEDFKTEFAKMVDTDIGRCESYLSGERDEETGRDLHLEMITKYPTYITNFGLSLYNYSAEFGFNSEYFSFDAMISNLKVIKNKLIAYKSFGYRNGSTKNDNKSINIENILTANQSQNVIISFEAAKKKIENMTALSADETKEIIEKIDELKSIIDSKDNKKSKWQKIKPVLVWLANKSVDVGMTLLPLLLKVEG